MSIPPWHTSRMPLHLSDYDLSLLAGDHGPAPRLAMSILVRMAQIWGAHELLDISGAHIDSTIYIGAAGLEFAERLASLGARVAVPTTLNVSGLDEQHWQEWAVPAEWAAQAQRQMVAYRSMGVQPTWTCAPYQTQWKPAFGQQVAWGESNAIAFANSVLGARTERYPDLLDICCAITGRVPRSGSILRKIVPASCWCAWWTYQWRCKRTICCTRCLVTSWASSRRTTFPPSMDCARSQARTNSRRWVRQRPARVQCRSFTSSVSRPRRPR